MNSQHLKFAELVQTIDAVFYQIEMNNFLEVDNVINPDFTNFFNGFDSYITLHDLQKLKPIFINDKMKNYYGFEKNTFQDIDYFYYFTTIHPSSYHTLLDSVVHFKKGGEGYLKLEYKLKNNVGKFLLMKNPFSHCRYSRKKKMRAGKIIKTTLQKGNWKSSF